MKKEDILSRFMQQMNDDPKYLRDVVLNFLLAGKDTIAITMTWFIYMLCKHPEIQEKDPKICFGDDVLPDGYSVKKGDMVTYMPYAMGRMKFLWGDDAHDFKPERWLDHNGIFHPENPFKFTAFQAGPRICLGRDFAYRYLKIFSCVLLGCFVFKLSDANKIATYKTTLNLSINGP
ncbi:hypothetical protein R6Q59_001596 [Mikania micrantha]